MQSAGSWRTECQAASRRKHAGRYFFRHGDRKPLSFASVAITLDNSDHKLPVDFNEVTVTRRLYRSGESEYLINGSACRLKDINEIFYDTGIGKEGYSIIGQGQIDKILSGKPEERASFLTKLPES